MNTQFIEPLETRQFLSADLLFSETQDLLGQVVVHVPQAAAAARVSSPSIVGVYGGTSTTRFGQEQLTLTITRQRKGRFAGRMTNDNHPGVSLRVSGTITGRRIKFAFAGRDTDGRAKGNGTGTISADGSIITVRFRETEARTTFAGRAQFNRK